MTVCCKEYDDVDGCHPRVGHYLGCGSRGEPFVAACENCEDQQEVADIPWRSLILAAHDERAFDGSG